MWVGAERLAKRSGVVDSAMEEGMGGCTEPLTRKKLRPGLLC
jgi:hypothetical protein